MSFHSYHWRDQPLTTLREAQAAEALRDGLASAADWKCLLRSEDPVANGVALDQFHRRQALGRHGAASPAADPVTVLAVARRLLDAPAVPGSVPDASHASALLALMNDADATDAGRITRVLNGEPSAATREAATLAARACLESGLDDGLIRALGVVALDAAAELETRRNAITAMADAWSPTVEALACGVLARAPFKVAVEAAWILAHNAPDRYREDIAARMAEWPADSHLLDDVREALAPEENAS